MIPRPQADEHSEFLAGYIGRVPDGADIFALLSSQPDELRALLAKVTDEQAGVRPAPGEWSVKEIIAHLSDTERIFAYRGVCIARGETKSLPGFEQDAYMSSTDFNTRSLSALLEEFTAQRRANVLCFQALTEAELVRRGTSNDNPLSVRAVLYVLIGHVMHHIESLITVYKVAG